MRLHPFAFVIAALAAFGLSNAARASIIIDNVTPANTVSNWTYGSPGAYPDAKGTDLLYASGVGPPYADGVYTSLVLAPGTYDVYLYYYNFSADTFVKFSGPGSFQDFGTGGIPGTVWGSNSSYVYAYLGTVSNVTGFSVDFHHAGPDSYMDAIGYELTPEPASLALLGIGGVVVLRRRAAPRA